MKSLNFLTSACRYCQYYQPEGRRAGICRQLGVPVAGGWKACNLAIPAFAPAWEGLERIIVVPDETPILSDARSLGCTLDNSATATAESTIPPQKGSVLWYITESQL